MKIKPQLNQNIMNTTIVSAEAKARLTEAVNNYTPPAPEKYRALNEVKDSIIALRERKASYETIRAMLHENAGIEVSHQTVARYCREVLDSAKAKEAAPSQDATDRTTGSRPRGIGSASAIQPVTVTRTAHHAFKKSLAQQRRCRQSRRPRATQKQSAHPKKQKPLGSVSATNARYTAL